MAQNQFSDPSPDGQKASAQDRLRHLSAVPRQGRYTPRHTRRVRALRVVLPAVALLAVAIVILWPRIRAEFNRPTETSAEERQPHMVSGRYVGSDAHGRPYTVTYDSATQPPAGGPIDMVNPLAELTLQNGHWVAVKAERGRYDQSTSVVDLYGHVEFFHDDGYRFTTEVAHVEFSKNLIWGDRAVVGRGPKAEVEARGFRIINNGDAFTFTGPTRLLLRPDAARIDVAGDKKP